MSDYLWDKTGEPEEDVARLEQLLGTLRYEPRPLELPDELRARAARGKFWPRQWTFNWQRLAVAASLLLTLLAGAWLVTRLNKTEVHRESAQQTQAAPDNSAPVAPEKASPDQTANNNQPAPRPVVTPDGEPVNYRPAKHVSKRGGANANRRAPRAVTQQPQEQVAMTPAQREATEKLLLALRITSAKLNYAQREVHEMTAARRPETK